jgi:hypothetical protein
VLADDRGALAQLRGYLRAPLRPVVGGQRAVDEIQQRGDALGAGVARGLHARGR